MIYFSQLLLLLLFKSLSTTSLLLLLFKVHLLLPQKSTSKKPFSHWQRKLIEAKPIVYKYKAEGSKVLMQSTAIALFCNHMDSIFFLEDEARAHVLQTMGRAIGCTYICLWSYLPPPQK